MTSYVSKLVAKKLLGETARNKFGYEDPYFENVPATKLDGKPGRVRKKRKAIPPGLSDHDTKVLTKVKRRAYRLDCKWSLMGFRFGISSLIAVIPLIGDGFDILLACMVVRTCQQVEGGLPPFLLLQMYISILLDFVIGLVPIVGDIGDAAYKANTKNAARLEAFLREKGAKNLRSSGMPVPEVDPSDPSQFEHFQEQGTATFSPDLDNNGVNTSGTTTPQLGNISTAAAVRRETRPEAATAGAAADTGTKRSGGNGGVFGFFRRGPPAPDVERGTTSPRTA
jgi:hypothetical protein